VERVRRFPLARAMRVDKLTLAALEATLRGPAPPVRAALDVPVAELRARAEALTAALEGVDVRVVDSAATVGGGGGPGVTLPSVALSLPERYAPALRAGSPAVLGRLEAGRCLLDLRALAPTDDQALAGCVRAVEAGR
jgi:L-seryl-tRNA(Ser) seleniumtransferase